MRLARGRSCGRLPSRYKSRVDPGLDRSLNRFREVLDLITLAAFGSRVRGQARPEGDLDILYRLLLDTAKD